MWLQHLKTTGSMVLVKLLKQERSRRIDVAIFASMVGLSVYMDEMKQSPFHPSSSCGAYVLKWRESGLETMMNCVRWESMRHRTDIEALVGITSLRIVYIDLEFFCYLGPSTPSIGVCPEGCSTAWVH